MTSTIKGIAPRDQVETMLAAQMAAVDMVCMTSAGWSPKSRHIPSKTARTAFKKLTPHLRRKWRY